MRATRVGFVMAMALAATIAPSAQQAAFRARADATIIDVSVRDGRRIVSGLRVEDFILTDNGVRQTIVDASIESLPFDVSILLDVSESTRRVFGDSLTQASSRFRHLLRPDDRVDVRLVGGRIVDADQWDGRPLGSWADGAWTGDRGTSLWDAMVGSLVRPADSGFRRLIIMLTDGKDSASFTTRAMRVAVVDRADAVVQIVATGLVANGVTVTQSGGPQTAQTVINGIDFGALMQEIARHSGGRYFNLNDSRYFVDALDAAIQEFRTRYLLRYVPRGVDVGGWHTVSVAVKGKKYDVQAKQHYWGGTPSSS